MKLIFLNVCIVFRSLYIRLKIQEKHVISFKQQLLKDVYCFVKGIHTYIHNRPLQPFSQDQGLVSHTAHVGCVDFRRKWWDIQFNDRFYEKLLMTGLFILRDFSRNPLRRNHRKIFFFIQDPPSNVFFLLSTGEW